MSQRTPKAQSTKKKDLGMRNTYHAKRSGNNMMSPGPVSRADAQQAISRKRDELNMELMSVLEEETQAETLRENKLKQCADETERRRLDKIFGIERAKASERIIQTSDRHDALLRQEMASLGITF